MTGHAALESDRFADVCDLVVHNGVELGRATPFQSFGSSIVRFACFHKDYRKHEQSLVIRSYAEGEKKNAVLACKYWRTDHGFVLNVRLS